MANIQPYNYQESTNIEEHNQIVNKVNEIVEVINNVNLDTINSEIANLKTKATETDTEIANIKNKDTTQDTEINGITKNLVSNVTATFDNPSRELKISLGREVSPSIDATVVIPASSETGQYSAGNGITIDNYQIAVDTNVVALKTDIPVVPDVTNLTQRVTTLETEMPTKVNINQGVENAGKVLGIGSDGNVTPVNAGGSGGGDWEEVNFSSWPTDWNNYSKVRVQLKSINTTCTSTTWTAGINNAVTTANSNALAPTMELDFSDKTEFRNIPISSYWAGEYCSITTISFFATNLSTSNNIFFISGVCFNATGYLNTSTSVKKENISTYVHKMWRLRKSS